MLILAHRYPRLLSSTPHYYPTSHLASDTSNSFSPHYQRLPSQGPEDEKPAAVYAPPQWQAAVAPMEQPEPDESAAVQAEQPESLQQVEDAPLGWEPTDVRLLCSACITINRNAVEDLCRTCRGGRPSTRRPRRVKSTTQMIFCALPRLTSTLKQRLARCRRDV